jgi:hypothetical protein
MARTPKYQPGDITRMVSAIIYGWQNGITPYISRTPGSDIAFNAARFIAFSINLDIPKGDDHDRRPAEHHTISNRTQGHSICMGNAVDEGRPDPLSVRPDEGPAGDDYPHWQHIPHGTGRPGHAAHGERGLRGTLNAFIDESEPYPPVGKLWIISGNILDQHIHEFFTDHNTAFDRLDTICAAANDLADDLKSQNLRFVLHPECIWDRTKNLKCVSLINVRTIQYPEDEDNHETPQT